MTLLLFGMGRKKYSDFQSVSIISHWLGEESEDDDSYCSLAELSNDEVDNILIKDAAEIDDSSPSSAAENDVLLNSSVSTA